MANDKRMDCVILGLLSHEALTGYDIKKKLDTSLSFFWSGSYGSIYPTLNKLSKEGLIVATDSTLKEGRAKILYSLTPEGHAFLKAWLTEPVIKDELRYETLLKLFFGGELGRVGALEHIKRFEEKIKPQYELLQMIVESLKAVQEEKDHVYYLLTAMFGVETYEAYLRWCEKAKKELKKNETK